MSELSEDAKAIAFGLFMTGYPQSLTFRRPHIIHPRTLAALKELTKAGMLREISPADLPKGAQGWQATKEMGRPKRVALTKANSWPVTTE